MPVCFRTYRNDTRFGADYYAVRDFLLRLNHYNYLFGRWDWMITHGNLNEAGLEKIGLWEDGRTLVAVATYDCGLGGAWLLALPEYAYLRDEMLAHAQAALAADDGGFRVLIPDGDETFQLIASERGYFPTQDKEYDAALPIDTEQIQYTLPEGFTLVSMKDRFDLYQYGRALWKGFNHEINGQGSFQWHEEERGAWELEFLRPHVNLDLKIAAVAPNGDFVAYCGMWQDDASPDALVEPVCTDPAYRRMGLGRAVVLEAVRRCGALGAKRAFVGSSQSFYYHIGFWPYATATWWERRKKA